MRTPEPAAPVPSPCIQVCKLDAQQICSGCGRSLDEIAQWPQADTPRRLQIRQRAAQRLRGQGFDKR